MAPGLGRGRAREQLVPGAEPRPLAVDDDGELARVERRVAESGYRPSGPRALRQASSGVRVALREARRPRQPPASAFAARRPPPDHLGADEQLDGESCPASALLRSRRHVEQGSSHAGTV